MECRFITKRDFNVVKKVVDTLKEYGVRSYNLKESEILDSEGNIKYEVYVLYCIGPKLSILMAKHRLGFTNEIEYEGSVAYC